MAEFKIGPMSLRYGEKMPDPGLPGPSPEWVTFQGIPYEPADRAVGDKRTWLASSKVMWAVERSVRLICENASQVPVRLYSGTPKQRKEIEDHPLLDLLRRPNPYDVRTWIDFNDATLRTLLLRGENFWRLVFNRARLPAEMYWYSPDMTQALPDARTWVRGFRVMAGSSEEKIDPSEMMWWRFWNPLDRFGGLSVIESLRQSINIDVSAATVQRSLYSNGGMARGVWTPDNKDGVGFGKETMDALQLEWMERHGTSARAHSVGFLSHPMKWTDMSMTEDEAQWIAARQVSRMEVFSGFGIPMELGTSESKSYDNLRSARLSFWHETMTPLLRRRDAWINSSLVPFFDPNKRYNLFAEFDLTDVPALRPDMEDLERMENEAIRLGRVTINESRERRGLQKVPWGDGYWGPLTYVDLSKGDGTPFPRITESIQTPASETVVPVEPSGVESPTDQPNPAATDPLGPEKPAEDALGLAGDRLGLANGGKRVPQNGKARRKALPVVRTPEVRAALGDRHARAIATVAQNLAHDIRGAWAKQRDAIIANLPAKRRKIADAASLLVSAQADLMAAALVALQAAGTEAYESTKTQIEDAIEKSSKGRKDALSLVFSVTNPALAQIVQDLGKRIVNIDQTTLDSIQATVEEGLRRGYSVHQIADGVAAEDYPGITGVFDSWDGRADVIARTETSWAFNQASVQAYKDSGVVEQKEWLVGMGDDKGLCQALDGEVVNVDDTFSDGSFAPPDPHPNCTCTILPVVSAASPAEEDDTEKALDALADLVMRRLVARANSASVASRS